MVLLRHLLGDALRRLRLRQGRTLREVSASARVSLGYLSEVERGQKEASSELLAAICSALGTPLSQVLREVSDNFALAELQSESVFADVIGPPIAVGKSAHAPARQGGMGEQVPVASVSRSAGRQPAVPVPTVAAMSAASGQLAGGRKVAVPAGVRLPLASSGLPASGVLPAGGGLPVGEPVFEQVTRTVREITNMVPV